MSLEAELIMERRLKGRRSAFWRGVLATFAVLIVLGAVAAWRGVPEAPRGPHIVTHDIFGIIYNDPQRDRAIADLADDPDVRALMLYIESPGGTTVGAEGLHDAITRAAAEMPVVVVMGEVAASGGYIAALAGDHLVARGNTITGSIGVILEYPDMTELLGNLGVEMQTFRSSDVKGGPSPFRELTPQQAVEQQAMIEEAYKWFRGLVGDERGLSGAALDRVAQGQVFSGRQALELDLIDAVGGQIEAESWLATQDPDLADLPYHPLFEPEEGDSLLNLISEWAGVSRLLPPIGQSGGAGLLSVLR